MIPQAIIDEFPLDNDLAHLNHAAMGPWPRRTHQAICAFSEENIRQGAFNYTGWVKMEKRLRQSLASLINAPSGEDIALLKNTSEALSVVAWGLDWRDGDNIVISNEEFPSNRIVWESLSELGVQLRMADLRASDEPEQALMDLCDRNTRLLAVSTVQYSSGIRIDEVRLGEFCRQRDILFCLDAIQSVGAVRLDAQASGADFIMADGHKWMLGPEGVALFYSRPQARERLRLRQFGWHMVQELGNYDSTRWQPAPGGRRFECGSPNMLGIHALQASVSLLLELGMDQVEQALLDNTAWLIDRLLSTGHCDLRSPMPGQRRAGIVAMDHRRIDNTELFRRLTENKVYCALRGGLIRLSPHFYTRQSAMEQALAIIAGD